MSKLKKLNECENYLEKEDRIKELRNNIVKCSNEKFEIKDNSGIAVNWGWINYLELRFDNKKDASKDDLIMKYKNEIEDKVRK